MSVDTYDITEQGSLFLVGKKQTSDYINQSLTSLLWWKVIFGKQIKGVCIPHILAKK